MNTQGESQTGSDYGAGDRFDARPVSERVVEGVADALDAEIAEIEPLYTVIDPDALDNLFGSTSGGLQRTGEVAFTMSGCEVVVDEAGAVEVTPMDGADRDAGTATE